MWWRKCHVATGRDAQGTGVAEGREAQKGPVWQREWCKACGPVLELACRLLGTNPVPKLAGLPSSTPR